MDIDAVITWVDGSQAAHRQQLQAHLSLTGMPDMESAHATRFHDAGEIDYCVASIQRYAPWFRHIYVVTNGQAPDVLRRISGTPWEQRIKLVEHRQIFAGYEQHLPTFNSRSIISLLWRIDGISERFVLFNDDFMLMRPTRPEDFFQDGSIVLRGRWRLQSRLGFQGRASNGANAKASARRAQELSARIAGYRWRYLRLGHAPYGFRKSLLKDFFERHPKLLEANIRHRLRSAEQFKAEVLLAHLALGQRSARVDHSLGVARLDPVNHDPAELRRRMKQADRSLTTAFACVQSLDRASTELRAEILAWLARRIALPDALTLGDNSPLQASPG